MQIGAVAPLAGGGISVGTLQMFGYGLAVGTVLSFISVLIWGSRLSGR
jgi:hypothetical protein